MDLKQLLATVPERELVILSGVEDPNFQPVDEGLIAKAQSEAKRINDILNGMQGDIEKKPYFESIEAALESSYGFLRNEYDVRDGDPAMEEMYFQRAKSSGFSLSSAISILSPDKLFSSLRPESLPYSLFLWTEK